MATTKTPAKVKRIIADAKREQNRIMSAMVSKIGRLMSKKKGKKARQKKRRR